MSKGVSLSKGGCLSEGVSVQARGGSLSRGSLSRQGGLCQGDPPDRGPHTHGEERAVCILLECILVVKINSYFHQAALACEVLINSKTVLDDEFLS